jgi:activator of HSP90 ATPase
MMNDRNNLAKLGGAPTRRQMIVGTAVALPGIAIASVDAWAGLDGDISRACEVIHQEVVFKASRKRVYEALIDTKQFDKVVRLALQSGMSLGDKPTDISREAGGAFTIFAGHIIGRQIELVPNERIVQVWRVVDWAPGHYSIAKFELTEQGPGTKLIFDHTGFPEGLGQHLAEGWKGHYWEALEKILSQE